MSEHFPFYTSLSSYVSFYYSHLFNIIAETVFWNDGRVHSHQKNIPCDWLTLLSVCYLPSIACPRIFASSFKHYASSTLKRNPMKTCLYLPKVFLHCKFQHASKVDAVFWLPWEKSEGRQQPWRQLIFPDHWEALSIQTASRHRNCGITLGGIHAQCPYVFVRVFW